MASSMSKRQQARNERDLQDLISTVPGNDRCADCQARNPGWASWSLGVFLCMRCAALHRKLGTHISKVKSLSMDTWSTEQVENMKQNGNTAVNKTYNPKNIKPGIPLDLDEVDAAMERFIRQKYQERSLANGKPMLPSRDESPPPSRSTQPTAQPTAQPPSPRIDVQPTKKGKIFGFKLRASSSAYPVSKRNTRNLPPLEPTIENSFHAEVSANKPSKPRISDVEERDQATKDKLSALREMGFADDKRNASVLKRLSGDMARTVESLVRLGGNSRGNTPVGSAGTTPSRATFPVGVSSQGTSPAAVNTKNPFDAPARAQTLAVPSNAFQSPGFVQPPATSIDQAFQSMQVSQPLFPHSTGGYPTSQAAPVQDPRFQHSMTPPVVSASQYAYNPQQPTMYNNNPFLQAAPQQALNPFDPQGPVNAPFSAPPTNPFFSQQFSPAISPAPQSATISTQSLSNPFGLPPPPQSAPAVQQSHNIFDIQAQSLLPSSLSQQAFPPVQPASYQTQPLQSPPLPQQSTIQSQNQPFASPATVSFPSQTIPNQQFSPNPFAAQMYSQPSPSPLHQNFSAQQPQPPQFQPQPARIDKNSILALYNYPQLAPQSTAATPDPSTTFTPGPLGTLPPPTQPQTLSPARRSATMPISPAAATNSKNPFLAYSPDPSPSNFPQPSPFSQTNQIGPTTHLGVSTTHRHASQESVSISNLENGRHSPDAFANLSARFVR